MLNIFPVLEVSPTLKDLPLILHFTPTHICLTSFVAAGMYSNGVFTHLEMCCDFLFVCAIVSFGLTFVEKCLVNGDKRIFFLLVRLETERKYSFI